MEKATGCSSLSINVPQKKRVRFFLDTAGWEGGRTLKAAEPALPCQEGAARLLLSGLASAPSSSLQAHAQPLGFAAGLSGPETAGDPWEPGRSLPEGLLASREEGSAFPLCASLRTGLHQARACRRHLGFQAILSQTLNVKGSEMHVPPATGGAWPSSPILGNPQPE